MWGRGTWIILIVVGWAATSRAQEVQVVAETREFYAGVPFILTVVAEGFAEEPKPQVAPFSVGKGEVQFLEAHPEVFRQHMNVNGKITESTTVRYNFRYRVTVPSAGNYKVPAIVVSQGNEKAKSRPVSFSAKSVAETKDMVLRIVLPKRPLWVGESFEVGIEWYLRRDPKDQSFVLPLFLRDDFEIEEPRVEKGERTLAFAAGQGEVDLPFQTEETVLDGTKYTRFRFVARARPKREGQFELEPARVVAKLQSGSGRDAFGFPSRRYSLFSASDRPVTVAVKAPPLTGKPIGFSGAVGEGFSWSVQADRTVVAIGDPIELSIRLRGDVLEGVSLPDLRKAGLPEAFSVPEESPVGKLQDDGSKLFATTVRLVAATGEIPALEFSYFDPKSASYKTAKSAPVALGVAGSTLVDARSVVSAREEAMAGEPGPGQAVVATGAILALSQPDRTLNKPMQWSDLKGWLVFLYLGPVVIFALMWRRKATAGRRGKNSELREAYLKAQSAVKDARKQPAREAAPRLLSAARSLARRRDLALEPELCARVENACYDPNSNIEPLANELLEAMSREVERLGRKNKSPVRVAAALTLLAVSAGPGWNASAAVEGPGGRASMEVARSAYLAAMASDQREARELEFARAADGFAILLQNHAHAPELLADWANAQLGAGHIGSAVLGYRKALRLNPGLERARRNLDWVRKSMPAWVPKPRQSGALESLFFWQSRWSQAQQHLTLAGCFAVFLLLLSPWPQPWRLRWRALAVVPGVDVRCAGVVPGLA